MIAESTACLISNPCARAELHQQECTQKLCSWLKNTLERFCFNNKAKIQREEFLVVLREAQPCSLEK